MDGIEEKRKELDALIEQKSKYFVICYECPVRVVCGLGDEALSARVSLMIRLPVKDEDLSDFYRRFGSYVEDRTTLSSDLELLYGLRVTIWVRGLLRSCIW